MSEKKGIDETAELELSITCVMGVSSCSPQRVEKVGGRVEKGQKPICRIALRLRKEKEK